MICQPCMDAADTRAPRDQHCTDTGCTCGHRVDRYRTEPTPETVLEADGFTNTEGLLAAHLRAQAGAIAADTWRQLAHGPEPADPIEITPYLVLQHYRTDRGNWAWSWRCWGAHTCDGHLALDLSSRTHAERNAHWHLATEHPAGAATPAEPTP